ncbi:MAG: acetamidase/formamidase family protein [Actinomycetota bacterium]|nr:acetamidase/formamidase family protein [Actinomycetota bacterium]
MARERGDFVAEIREIIQEGDHQFTMGPYAEPVARVGDGETVTIHTEDAFGGSITSEDDVPSQVLGPYLNPQTGPIFVEGAEPGDTLAVKIEDIEFTRDWAASCLVPFFGGLTSTNLTATLQEPLPERVWKYRIDGDVARRGEWEIPVRPFVGTIGTAPAIEARSALSPGDHGGNMDVPDTRPGNTVYLPVRADGALFYTGDCHVAQGQGELCGVALEVSAKVTVTFRVIKGKDILWPRIESDEHIMTVGSARPMEDAARIAYAELVGWLAEDHGFEKFDAYQLLTQVGELYVGNMVDTVYSLVARCPKRHLPG